MCWLSFRIRWLTSRKGFVILEAMKMMQALMYLNKTNTLSNAFQNSANLQGNNYDIKKTLPFGFDENMKSHILRSRLAARF